MNFAELLQTLETYAVDYVRYLLSITSRAAFRRRQQDIDPKLLTFSLISLGIGYYFYQKYVRGLAIDDTTMLSDLVAEFSVWVALSLLAYWVISVRRGRQTAYTGVLIGLLRVMPVAYVVGGYASFLIVNLWQLWARHACAPWYAYAGDFLIRLSIVAVYLPISLKTIDIEVAPDEKQSPSDLRANLAAALVFLAMVLIQAGKFGVYLVARVDADTAPFEAALDSPRGDPRRAAALKVTTDPVLRACLAGASCSPDRRAHDVLMEELQRIGRCE